MKINTVLTVDPGLIKHLLGCGFGAGKTADSAQEEQPLQRGAPDPTDTCNPRFVQHTGKMVDGCQDKNVGVARFPLDRLEGGSTGSDCTCIVGNLFIWSGVFLKLDNPSADDWSREQRSALCSPLNLPDNPDLMSALND